VFRSETRPVVYPQLEHSRLAGAIAAAWGNDEISRPPLPFDSFVRGVAEHDRGYGELDDDPIGGVAEERWLDIQRRGLAIRDGDAVVDVVAAFHIRRLVGDEGSELRRAAAGEFDGIVAERLETAGVARADAEAADVVTNLCDRIAFDLSCETETSGTVGGFTYTTSRDGVATIAPWPLGERELDVTVTGYEADGYPRELRPLPRTFRVRPA
jgi:uncharacterized protein DUF3891